MSWTPVPFENTKWTGLIRGIAALSPTNFFLLSWYKNQTDPLNRSLPFGHQNGTNGALPAQQTSMKSHSWLLPALLRWNTASDLAMGPTSPHIKFTSIFHFEFCNADCNKWTKEKNHHHAQQLISSQLEFDMATFVNQRMKPDMREKWAGVFLWVVASDPERAKCFT